LEGKGGVEVGSLPLQEVNPGDVVLIPPGCRQRITNTGQEDLIFLCFYDPRDETLGLFFLTTPPGDDAIEPLIPNHLFARVGDVGGHGRQPFQGIKSLFSRVVKKELSDQKLLANKFEATAG
jgi:hypothetical protein